MRKRQAKKIAKKRAARVKAVIRAAMHREPTQVFIGECSNKPFFCSQVDSSCLYNRVLTPEARAAEIASVYANTKPH